MLGQIDRVDPKLLAFLQGQYPPGSDESREASADRPAFLLGTGDVVPRFYGWPVGIRFELSGIGGTWSFALDRERNDAEIAQAIDQAATRAIQLFEATFAEDETGWFLGRRWFAQSWRQRFGRFALPSRKSAVDALGRSLPVEARSSLIVEAIPDWRDEEADATPRVLEATVAIAPRTVDYAGMLRGIAGSELGGGDRDVWESYFVSRESGVVFHMYDDRGLDILAPNAAAIEPIYERFGDWILDYDRERIDATFAS